MLFPQPQGTTSNGQSPRILFWHQPNIPFPITPLEIENTLKIILLLAAWESACVNGNPFWAKTWDLLWILMQSLNGHSFSCTFFPLIPSTRACYLCRTWSVWLKCGWMNTQSTFTSVDLNIGISLRGMWLLRRNFATISTARTSNGSWVR